jgi:hypothetical protein
VRFVHLYAGIATRHSDTMDCVFRVDGRSVTVAIPCSALTALREREGKYLTDQQLVEIAALHLRRTLEQGYDPAETELILGDEQFRTLARELGHL